VSGVNHIAVWVAGVVHFLLGAGWYTAFGQAWARGVGKTEAQIMAEQPNQALPLVIAFAVAVVIAYTIAALLPKLGAPSMAGGAKAGAALAVCLIATTLAMMYGFEARPVSLWLINSGYMIAGMALIGGIVGGWRKKS